MAVLTYRLAAGSAGTSPADYAVMSEVDQAAATRTDGWTSAKLAAGNSSYFNPGVKVASGTFSLNSGTPKPTSFAPSATYAFMRSPTPLTGSFAAGNWTLTFALRCATASAQRGRMLVTVWRTPDPTGGAVDLAGGVVQVGTTVAAALSTSADQTSTVTWNAPAITMNGDYLLFALAWEITTAGGSNSADVLLRTGQAAGGTRVVTTNFTSTLNPSLETLYDDFNRADGTVYAGAGSALWSDKRLDYDEVTGARVVGNRLGLTATAYHQAVSLGETTADFDLVLDAAAGLGTPPESAIWFGITTPPATPPSGYVLINDGAGFMTVRKYIAGVNQGNIASNATAPTLAAGDAIWIQRRAAGIRVCHKRGAGDWVQVMFTADSTYYQQARFAIEMAETTVRWDNVRGGPFVGLGPSISAADSVTTSDSLGLVQDYVISVADTVTATDAPSLVADLDASFADSVTASDLLSVVQDIVFGAADVVTATDSPLLESAIFLDVADSVVLSDSLELADFTPLTISGCTHWFDAADDSSVLLDAGIAEWHDKAGSDQFMAQYSPSSQPLRTTGENGRNGRPVLDFDGTKYMTRQGDPGFTVGACTIFVVCGETSHPQDFAGILGAMTSVGSDHDQTNAFAFDVGYAARSPVFERASNSAFISASPPMSFAVHSFQCGASGVFPIKNGVGGTPGGGAANGTPYGLCIGTRWLAAAPNMTYGLRGVIAEIVIYNRYLGSVERDQVEAYLTQKWLTPGAALTLNATDSVTTSDSYAQIADLGIALTDSVALSDLPDISLDVVITVTDSVTVTDDPQVELIPEGLELTASDSVTLSDVAILGTSADRPQFSQAFSASYELLGQRGGALSPERGGGGRTTVIAKSGGAISAESAGAAKFVTVEHMIAAADSVTASDSPALTYFFTLSDADAVTTSDLAALDYGFQVNYTDAVTASDSLVSVDVGHVIDVADSVTTSDALTLDAEIAVDLADIATTADALSLSLGIDLGAADTVTTSDALSLAQDISLAAADAVTTTDSLNVDVGGDITTADVVTASDVLTLAQDYVVDFADTAITSDSLDAAYEITLEFADAVTVVDDFFFPAFDPSFLAGLTVWVDATKIEGVADGEEITVWENLGGGGDGAIVGSPGPRLRENALNDLPVVRFAKDEGRVRGTGMVVDGTFDVSVFYIGRLWGANVGRFFTNTYPPYNFLVGTHTTYDEWLYDNGTPGNGIAWVSPSPWKIYEGVSSETPRESRLFINGEDRGATGASAGHDNRWNLSGYDATGTQETCDCEIAELVIYDRALTPAERIQVENYLYTKWFGPQIEITAEDSVVVSDGYSDTLYQEPVYEDAVVLTDALAFEHVIPKDGGASEGADAGASKGGQVVKAGGGVEPQIARGFQTYAVTNTLGAVEGQSGGGTGLRTAYVAVQTGASSAEVGGGTSLRTQLVVKAGGAVEGTESGISVLRKVSKSVGAISAEYGAFIVGLAEVVGSYSAEVGGISKLVTAVKQIQGTEGSTGGGAVTWGILRTKAGGASEGSVGGGTQISTKLVIVAGGAVEEQLAGAARTIRATFTGGAISTEISQGIRSLLYLFAKAGGGFEIQRTGLQKLSTRTLIVGGTVVERGGAQNVSLRIVKGGGTSEEIGGLHRQAIIAKRFGGIAPERAGGYARRIKTFIEVYGVSEEVGGGRLDYLIAIPPGDGTEGELIGSEFGASLISASSESSTGQLVGATTGAMVLSGIEKAILVAAQEEVTFE